MIEPLFGKHRGEKGLQLSYSRQRVHVQRFAGPIVEEMLLVVMLNSETESLGEDLKAEVQRGVVEEQRRLLDRFQQREEFPDQRVEYLGLFVGAKDRTEEMCTLRDDEIVRLTLR